MYLMSVIFEKDRRVYKTGKKNAYRMTYTFLEAGDYHEFCYDPTGTTIITRDEKFKLFAKRPYIVLPEENHFILITPSWTNLHVGWPDPRSTSEFNVFRVDRFALWADLVPKDLLDEFEFPEPPFKEVRVEGKHLVGPSYELEEAWRRYRKFLVRREKANSRKILERTP